MSEEPNINKFIELEFLGVNVASRRRQCGANMTPQNRIEKNRIEKKRKNKKEKKVDFFSLFPWLDISLWEDFREHRKTLKAPMTERAEKTILNKLHPYANNGDDPNKYILQAIERGWKGVFPDEKKKQAKTTHHKTTMKPV